MGAEGGYMMKFSGEDSVKCTCVNVGLELLLTLQGKGRGAGGTSQNTM